MKIQAHKVISPSFRAQRGKHHGSGEYNQSGQHNQSGFALVATVSMMVLLTLIALAMLSLSTIEQRSSGESEDAMRTAQANARMALMMAIGELQKAAGPDQRVTATASILGDAANPYASGTPAQNGRVHWAGVWDTSDYSPRVPDNKTFVRWLVSGSETAVDGIDDARTPPDNDTVTGDKVIFEMVDANGNPDPDGAGSVKVPKVEVVTTTAGNKSYYAYWVEDEGVKSDMAWNENEAASASSTDQDRAQARLLGSDPGPNTWLTAGSGALGPYRDPNDDGSTSDAIGGVTGLPTGFPKDEMEKVISLADLPLAAAGGASHSDWLKMMRHQMSFNNRGVLADVKQGGLRRDLSLAFEMDGDADITATEQPALFNQQVGEFVGGTDKNASAHDYPAASGLPRARHLFRETRDTGGPFSDKIYLKTTVLDNRNQSVVRGPTWWNLRDYYNLYKRLQESGSNYRLKARAYYPNRSSIGYAHSDTLDTITTWADHRDTDYRKPFQGKLAGQWRYVFRPARASYAPVLLGTTAILSVTADGTTHSPPVGFADIAITLDPIFYLWNPYNREIEVDNVLVHFETGIPGQIPIKITGTIYNNDGTPKLDANGVPIVDPVYDVDLWQLLIANLTNYQYRQAGQHGTNYGFIINGSPTSGSFTLQPGEVVAASPSSTSGQSYLGYDPLNNTSGIFMTSIDLAIQPAKPSPENLGLRGWWDNRLQYFFDNYVRVKTAPGETKINVGFHDPQSGGQSSGRFFMDASFGDVNLVASDLQDTTAPPGDQTQSTHMQLTETRGEFLAGDTEIFDTAMDLSTLVDVKQQFGLFTYLMKPANWTGQVYPDAHPKAGSGRNPVEIFSRFNPAPLVVNKDWWAAATPNMVYNFVADQSANSLINNNGLNFSTSARSAFWGKTCDSNGLTSVPMSNIPSSPLISLVDFGHATLGTMAEDPFHSVGNSLPSPVISPVAPYGTVYTGGGEQTYGTGTDFSWLINDALFDRYFLSGIVPEYTIGTGGYNATGSLNDTLERFYGIDPADPTQTVDPDTAQASPVMEAHVPAGKTAAELVIELTPTSTDHDVYMKIAAYCLQKGSFNINCTDSNAWGRFLRRSMDGVDIKFTDGTTDSRGGYIGFPSSSSPTPTVGTSARQTWSGWSRLVLSGEINNLATNLANEVKKRGPFMSVSDFVNRKVGDTNGDGVLDNSDITDQHQKGAIQAAIDTMTTNTSVYSSAGGVTTDYSKHSPLVRSTTQNTNTATGIPGSVTQANVLRALAPRLSARSDTFRIRAYGEVRDSSDKIIAMAMCEALVQRLPEYVDPDTNEDYNEPWDEYDPYETDPTKTLNATNQKYGRRFEIRSFRWLDDNEI